MVENLGARSRHAIERRLLIAVCSYVAAVVIALWSPVTGLAVFFASHVTLAMLPLNGHIETGE